MDGKENRQDRSLLLDQKYTPNAILRPNKPQTRPCDRKQPKQRARQSTPRDAQVHRVHQLAVTTWDFIVFSFSSICCTCRAISLSVCLSPDVSRLPLHRTTPYRIHFWRWSVLVLSYSQSAIIKQPSMCRGPNTTTPINQSSDSHEMSDPNEPRQPEAETWSSMWKNSGCRINEAGGEY